MSHSIILTLVMVIIDLYYVRGYNYSGISTDLKGCCLPKWSPYIFPIGRFRPSPELCEFCDCFIQKSSSNKILPIYVYNCSGCAPDGSTGKCTQLIEMDLVYPYCCPKPGCWLQELP